MSIPLAAGKRPAFRPREAIPGWEGKAAFALRRMPGLALCGRLGGAYLDGNLAARISVMRRAASWLVSSEWS